MAAEGYDFDNPAFDPAGSDMLENEPLPQLPDVPILRPPDEVQQSMQHSGDGIAHLRGEIREQELKAQRDRMVDAFYGEIERSYGLGPTKIDYNQFTVDDDGKTLYWQCGDKKIRISAEKGGTQFRGLSTLAKDYGSGGTNAIRTYLQLPDYSVKSSSRKAVSALQKAANQLPASSHVENVPLQDLSGLATEASDVAETAMSELDAPGLASSMRELQGLDRAMQTVRGELTNNLAKLSALDDHIALEKRKLEEAADDEFSRLEIAKRIRNLEDERSTRLEAAGSNREALRTQINRIRETINRALNENTTLAERLRILFREQGVTLASLITALGFIVSTLVLAVVGLTGGGSVPVPPSPPSDKKGIREWAKKHLQALGRALAKLAGRAAAALPGIIGSVVSWLLKVLAKTADWLTENLWALLVTVGGLLFMAAHQWLSL